jgi:hypothetical protein
MKLFYTLAALIVLSSSSVLPVEARELCDFCKALDTGIGSMPGKPTTCLIEIDAPTFGGEVALDVRGVDGKSIWDKPRVKQSKAGIVTYHIGCSQISSPTDQVYLCVDGTKGGDGKTYHSARFRAEGSLDIALKTHKLEMCLKGPGCPKWHPTAPEKDTEKE